MKTAVSHNNVAYIVLSDIHFKCRNARNRKNYFGEINHIFSQISELIDEYKRKGYTVKIILMGDVFDNSYTEVTATLRHQSYFQSRIREAEETYLLVGNHDIRYSKNNPLWSLVSEIQSKSLREQTKIKTINLGFLDDIKLVDTIEHEDVVLYFNHYGTRVQDTNKEKVSIGFFHTDFLDNEVKDIINASDTPGFYEGIKTRPVIEMQRYDYCYLGHFHTIFGTYKKENTVFTHLPSLGRPAVNEVNDDFLIRQIPIIEIQNHKLFDQSLREVSHLNREKSVKEEVVSIEQCNYQVAKASKLKADYQLLNERNPIDNIRGNLLDDPTSCRLLESLLGGNSREEILRTIDNELYKKSVGGY